jgi:hypothetical protein
MFGRTARFFALLGTLALSSGLAAGACGGGAGSAEKVCEPGENIFCRCSGGEAGTKTCKGDGLSFEACVTRSGACPTPGTGGSGATGATGGTGGSGATGATGGSSGGVGGATTGLPLFAACGDNAECESMDCRFGFCTQGCAKYDDCVLGKGECVPVKGVLVCTPDCQLTSFCEGKYGVPSACGFAQAVDGFGVTTCADWEDLLQLPPDGSDCANDEDCNLGNLGKAWVCSFNACTSGCYVAGDCAAPKTCSSSGNLGKCQ